MKPLVAQVGTFFECVNCRRQYLVPPEVRARVDLFICGGWNCAGRNAVVEVFDRIGVSA